MLKITRLQTMWFIKNDTKDQESGQIELNYDTRNNVITNNQIYASNSRIFY